MMTTFELPEVAIKILDKRGAKHMFSFRDEAAAASWQKLLEVQLAPKEDGKPSAYNYHIVVFAVLWACLMEDAIVRTGGLTPHLPKTVQDRCEEEADIYGNSGASFSMGRNALAVHWKYGDLLDLPDHIRKQLAEEGYAAFFYT